MDDPQQTLATPDKLSAVVLDIVGRAPYQRLGKRRVERSENLAFSDVWPQARDAANSMLRQRDN